jgi:hypothetical protein
MIFKLENVAFNFKKSKRQIENVVLGVTQEVFTHHNTITFQIDFKHQ